MTGSTKSVPSTIETQMCWWQVCFWFWNILHYLLGLSTALGAGLIAAVDSAKDFVLVGGTLPIKLPVVVALATAAMTFLRASAKANAYIQAWRGLNCECIIYLCDSSYDEQKLAQAHKTAEAIIEKVD